MNYPKIIHQTWKTNDIPEDWKISQLKWKELHPDFEYMFWTDNDIRNHIKTNHPTYLDLHDNYKHNIQRADMIRYFILYDFGGIYCDLDLYPIENIENHLLNYNSDILVCKSGNIDMITNSFIISKKNAPIWLKVQEKLKDKKPFFAIGKHLTVMYTTGSIMLSNMLKKNKEYFSLLPSEKFMAYSSNDDFNIVKEGAIILPLKGQSWNGIDSLIFNLLNKYREQITDLIIDEKMQKELSKSLFECSFIEEDHIGNIYIENLMEFQIKNIESTKYIIEYNFLDEDKKNVIIKSNHRTTDGFTTINNVFIEKQNIITNIKDISKCDKYLLNAFNAKNITVYYIQNKFLKKAFLNYSNTILKYNQLHIKIDFIKEKMKKYNILHTTTFLFSLLVYSYQKRTKATYIKCSNIYYIPYIEGNNKILDYVFIVDINDKTNDKQLFRDIYLQIYNNNKTIDEMWGLNILLNFLLYNSSDFTKQIKSSKDNKSSISNSSDVVFSNMPIKVPVDKMHLIYKTSQPEKLYCLCIGNELNELMFSLVYDESIDGIQDIFQETINNL